MAGELVTAAIGNTHWRDNLNYLLTASVEPILSVTFVDSGAVGFTEAGIFLVQVSAGNVIGSAIYHLGLNTTTGFPHMVTLASGVNGAGLVPTFNINAQDTAPGNWEVRTAGASGLTVTVKRRRLLTTG